MSLARPPLESCYYCSDICCDSDDINNGMAGAEKKWHRGREEFSCILEGRLQDSFDSRKLNVPKSSVFLNILPVTSQFYIWFPTFVVTAARGEKQPWKAWNLIPMAQNEDRHSSSFPQQGSICLSYYTKIHCLRSIAVFIQYRAVFKLVKRHTENNLASEIKARWLNKSKHAGAERLFHHSTTQRQSNTQARTQQRENWW